MRGVPAGGLAKGRRRLELVVRVARAAIETPATLDLAAYSGSRSEGPSISMVWHRC